MIEKRDDKVERDGKVVESYAGSRGFRGYVHRIVLRIVIRFAPRFGFGKERLVDDDDDIFVSDVTMSGSASDVILEKLGLLKLDGVGVDFLVIFRANQFTR